jgi:hypothetical protein
VLFGVTEVLQKRIRQPLDQLLTHGDFAVSKVGRNGSVEQAQRVFAEPAPSEDLGAQIAKLPFQLRVAAEPMVGFVRLLRGAEKITLLKFLARLRIGFFCRRRERAPRPAPAKAQ